ncbi:MAG: aminotransferase class I/II-fold pyridoxal phosphate-dependent enzyme [Balneolaceae bacterium]|nr:aminotransferase class I/II-fold pyridoxal phosphate-dependent enzyme [Balneolaceae bacterium]
MKVIDLRSDTVTKPTQQMKQVMLEAEVGDDVFGEDELTNNFQAKMATLFGMEAGLYVPSGTMSNQLALKVLTQPSNEVLIESKGHILQYETGGASSLSSVQLLPLQGYSGKLSSEQISPAVRGAYDWEPETKVVCIEHSTNKGGGTVYSLDELRSIKQECERHHLYVHVDGARIWNALVATGQKPKEIGQIADTLSICFSKGLGAPVGSMLLSSTKNIAKARRFRKMWGGGMRQIGLLTAAADYAVEHHWPKLALDHEHAKIFAQTIAETSALQIDLDSVQTNIVLFHTGDRTALEVLEIFGQHGIKMVPFGPSTVRATFHFQIEEADVHRLLEVTRHCFNT